MFQHHLLLIYRNFKRYKSSFLINLFGLSAGLCCALMIYLWVADELAMDKFHANSGRLFQVMENETTEDGINTGDGTSGLLAESLAKEMPEVTMAVTTTPTYWLEASKVYIANGRGIKAAGKFVSPDFLKAFSYPLIAGNIDQVLREKNNIVISEELAKKLFQTTDVVGREILWANSELKGENHALISGVFKNVPDHSSDHFDYLVPLEVLMANSNYVKWGNHGPNTFVVLKDGTDPDEFSKKIKDYMVGKGQNFRKLFIRPYADGYLYGKYENGVMTGGRIDYVQLFSLIAVFILVIACINFMNLSTAKASRRMKEVGIKKVMGASRKSLILQYMSESVLLTFLALFLALLGVELFLPQFNAITDKHLALNFSLDMVLTFLGIALFTGLLSGSYPALYLSGFNPAAALKGKLGNTLSELWTRRGLVVFQFTLSVILIVSVFVVYKQIEFVQTKSPGFKKDNVLYFETEGRVKGNINSFLSEVKKIPGVLHAGGMDRNFLGDLSATTGDFQWEGRNPKEQVKFQKGRIGSGLIETLGMTMADGRSFSDQYGSDSAKVLINEAGIKVMGLKNPVGKIFGLWGKDYQIIGVVKDFNFESLHKEVKPMFFRFEANELTRVMIKIKSGAEKQTVADLQQLYKNFNPGFVLDYRFLDQDFQAQYVSEQRVAILSRYFSALAVLISCLGLFGLATFTAERRLKEIGIRKVLGASELSLVVILSKDFTKPVIGAILIALPVSYIMTKYWLNTFAYRIELQIWYFVAAGLLALLISWLTVAIQSIKAAAADPVKCLKAE
ncbi:ABC-type transport system, involved in lipoprotein release, permease component [Pedobacter steynii]|uniref:ABC-type transport system, involved in lipoprotein release, permease component n=1 Tax=Pedobacter steynii TaxID=430522 RepID=A0A1H0B7B1_9SPHI|nr:ABC transporter permease [Pedobacter steynii]NQX41134.1 ABC transporter permease [Pedobacter steynii]SDN41575.1 ABC-type transport system, involved in lipoprotein release, permease component [Pedobacter steynii]